MGIVPGQSDLKGLAQQALGSVGRLTTWVGTAVGALTSLFMVMVIGLFVAMEPRIYDRGLQWMVPRAEHRSEEHTSELQSLMRISYAVFCLKKKKTIYNRLQQEDKT